MADRLPRWHLLERRRLFVKKILVSSFSMNYSGAFVFVVVDVVVVVVVIVVVVVVADTVSIVADMTT